MSVGRICTREVHLADGEEPIEAAAQRMFSRKVGALVVLDEARRPVGIITDRDLAVRAVGANHIPRSTSVRDVMTREPKSLGEEAPIETALALMRAGAFRRVPVVGSDGKLVGLVTLDDILGLLAEEFADIRRVIEEESP